MSASGESQETLFAEHRTPIPLDMTCTVALEIGMKARHRYALRRILHSHPHVLGPRRRPNRFVIHIEREDPDRFGKSS